MITHIHLFLIMAGILALYGIYRVWFKKNRYSTEDKVLSTILILPFLSVAISAFIAILIQFIDGKTSDSYKTTCNIVSIRNDDVTSGRFMLGCGSIKQIEYYFYFYKTINGGYARGKKNVNETEIIEDNSSRPHIETLTTHYESRTGLIEYRDTQNRDYIIVVPKGTILNKFELY